MMMAGAREVFVVRRVLFSTVVLAWSFVGAFPARAVIRAIGFGRSGSVSIETLTLTWVCPRIFTPNADGANDKVVFHFDNPEQLPVSGTIYDLPGAKVADLSAGSDPVTLLMWNGKDSEGRVVPGGLYLYQIEFEGKIITGTVVVAR